jgi:hypothetical protein
MDPNIQTPNEMADVTNKRRDMISLYPGLNKLDRSDLIIARDYLKLPSVTDATKSGVCQSLLTFIKAVGRDGSASDETHAVHDTVRRLLARMNSEVQHHQTTNIQSLDMPVSETSFQSGEFLFLISALYCAIVQLLIYQLSHPSQCEWRAGRGVSTQH